MTNPLRKISTKDWILIAVTLILFTVLCVKSIVLDPYKPTEGKSLSAMEETIDTFYDGFLYDKNIVVIRIVDIKEEQDVEIAKVRKYLFGVLPFGDGYVERKR